MTLVDAIAILESGGILIELRAKVRAFGVYSNGDSEFGRRLLLDKH